MPTTPVDARLDSERSRSAGRPPAAGRVRLAAPASARPVEPADRRTAGYGDAGYWAVTRHADVDGGDEEPGGGRRRRTRPSCAGWTSPTATGRVDQEPPALHGPTPAHPGPQGGEPVLHPRALAGLEDELRERAHRIVWAAKREGTGDFVLDVARHLPLQAIAGLMGIPDADRQQLFHWSDQMAGSEDPEYASMRPHGRRRDVRLRPRGGRGASDNDLGDVTSRLVQPDATARRLSSEEFAFFFMILAVAGNETTRQAITHGMLAFLQHPDQWERWRPERPATAVDEILRWASPAVVLQRTATEDTEIAGRVVPAGRAGGPVLRLRQLRRGGVRRPSAVRHRPHAQSPRHLRRRRLALLHRGQPLPARAEGDVRRDRRRAPRHRAARDRPAASARRGSTASSTCRSTTEALPG